MSHFLDIVKTLRETDSATISTLKGTGDVSGMLVLGLAFMDIVPVVAAVFTLFWMFFRMIETGVRVYRLLFTSSARKHDGELK